MSTSEFQQIKSNLTNVDKILNNIDEVVSAEAELKKHVPLGRFGEAEEVAE